ncbi:MAG TPA: aspartyl protease family protein [Caulobacteraceae bacterium]|nr:aspartyl protease family protein [Caulobacteraceae bacterium]
MISRRGLLANLVLLGAGGAAVWYFRDRILWAEPQPKFEVGGSSGWLPFATTREPLPTMKATINGREVEALLDSGAQYSVIDKALADELALPSTFAPIVAVGVGGQPQMGRGATAEVTVGALTFQGLKTGVLELGPIASPKGLGTPLILGQDVLRQVVADIDFPNRRLMLASADEHQLPAGAQPAPVFSRGRALAAQIFIGSTQVEAVIDTGASVVLALSREIAESAGLLTGQKPRVGQSVVLGGAMAGEIVRAEAIAFAGQVFTDVDVMLYQAQKLPGFPRALIGVGALRRFRAILDHAAGEMHLVRPRRS